MTVNRFDGSQFSEVSQVGQSDGSVFADSSVKARRADGFEEIWPATTLPDSIVSRWEATAGGGTTLTDTVGSDDLTINGATWVSNSKYQGGAALDYDGIDDSADAEISYETGPSKATTYSFWVDGHTGSGDDDFDNQLLSFFSTNDDASIGIAPDSNGSVFLYTSGDNTLGSGSKQINDGNIHHVVVVYDQANDTVSQYIDNSLDYSITYTNTADQIDSRVEVAIGRESRGAFYADATIDDVAVFDEALSAEQVDTIYNAHPST